MPRLHVLVAIAALCPAILATPLQQLNDTLVNETIGIQTLNELTGPDLNRLFCQTITLPTEVDHIVNDGMGYISQNYQRSTDLKLYSAIAWPINGPSSNLADDFLHVQVIMLSTSENRLVSVTNNPLNKSEWGQLSNNPITSTSPLQTFETINDFDLEKVDRMIPEIPYWHLRIFRFPTDPFYPDIESSWPPDDEARTVWVFAQVDDQTGYFVAPDTCRGGYNKWGPGPRERKQVTPDTMPAGIQFLPRDPPVWVSNQRIEEVTRI